MWILIKLTILILLLIEGVSVASEHQSDAPPLWIAPICGGLGVCLGLALWQSKSSTMWREADLWRANPFKYFLRPFHREAFYYPPFYHLGAVGFTIGGLGALVFGVAKHPESVGYGALLFSAGIGWWIGIKLCFFLRSKYA
jgi:hypothetical protein